MGSNNEKWNLEEEIVKVIDMGISEGLYFKTGGEVDHLKYQWNLEMEVAKVIERGISLGDRKAHV